MEVSTTSTSPTPRKPRKGCIDVFNGFMLDGADLAGPYGIPKIAPSAEIPNEIVPFSEAVSGRAAPDRNRWVHFYEDDAKIERFWKRPEYYADKLSGFGGFISPDFSLYADFTPAQKIWNTYRNYASGAWLQRAKGYGVIANVRTSGWNSVPYSLAGTPKNSPIAIGSHGCLKNRSDREAFVRDLKMVIDILSPSIVIVYGTDAYGSFNYPRELGIPVKVFPSTMSQRLGDVSER